MIRRLLVATRLVVLVQARGYFPHVFAVFTAMVIAVLLWIVPESARDLVLPAFLVSEPGILGLNMVAAHRYLELGNQSAAALHVSPLRPGEYLLALLLGSALLGATAGGATFAIVAGIDARLIALIPVLFVFALLSGLLGFALSMRYRDFPRFILGVIPAVGLWQLPLLAVYGVVPVPAVLWIPSAPGILGIAELCRGAPRGGATAALVVSGIAVAILGFALVQRLYAGRLRAGLELA